MAKQNKNFQKKKITEEFEDGNFGGYSEEHGGGTPVNGGGRGAWTRKGKPGHRVGQPRTDDGKFTYNSVNGKGLKYKSRGKTVNPLLTGGENGVSIEEVEKQFSAQSGKYWDKYNNKWYRKGSMIVLGDKKTRVAGETVWEVAKRGYDEVKGEFKGESEVFGGKAKVGAKSKEEQAAIKKIKKKKDEVYVTDQKTGGIKLKNGTVLPFVPKGTTPTTGTQPTPTPVVPTAPTSGTQPGASAQPSVNVNSQNISSISNADYTPKYSDEDISDLINSMKDIGFDDEDIENFKKLSPKEKDEWIDKHTEQE